MCLPSWRTTERLRTISSWKNDDRAKGDAGEKRLIRGQESLKQVDDGTYRSRDYLKRINGPRGVFKCVDCRVISKKQGTRTQSRSLRLSRRLRVPKMDFLASRHREKWIARKHLPGWSLHRFAIMKNRQQIKLRSSRLDTSY